MEDEDGGWFSELLGGFPNISLPGQVTSSAEFREHQCWCSSACKGFVWSVGFMMEKSRQVRVMSGEGLVMGRTDEMRAA